MNKLKNSFGVLVLSGVSGFSGSSSPPVHGGTMSFLAIEPNTMRLQNATLQWAAT